MLKIPHKISMSSTHGLGVFATAVIEAGTEVWAFDHRIDKKFTAWQIAELSPSEQLLRYFYRNKVSGLFVLCGDDARFMNHSYTPNLVGVDNNRPEGINVAAKRIEVGDELTCNYDDFDSLVNLETWEINYGERI